MINRRRGTDSFEWPKDDDRRKTPYCNNIDQDLIMKLLEEKVEKSDKDKKEPFTLPFIWQVMVTIGTILITSVGLYITNHDEQLRMQLEFKSFQERYKEDQERHTQTHNKIFEELKQLTIHTQSLEESVGYTINRRTK